MLESECRDAGVRIFLNSKIREVQHTTCFVVRTESSEFHARALVVATGGLSIPKMGATGFGYDLARQFGLRVHECRPGLVPLTFSGEDRSRYCDLAGVSAEVIASHDRQSFREKMLITHRGVSGPAILQISSYWRESEPVAIDLAPGREITSRLQQRDLNGLKSLLREVLAARFADRWLAFNAPSRWTNQALAEFEQRLHRWEIAPAGTEGFDKAEVTAGGVDTGELLAKTMESRAVPGLFFIGEVVDVTGPRGAFNFRGRWPSGYGAGQAL